MVVDWTASTPDERKRRSIHESDMTTEREDTVESTNVATNVHLAAIVLAAETEMSLLMIRDIEGSIDAVVKAPVLIVIETTEVNTATRNEKRGWATAGRGIGVPATATTLIKERGRGTIGNEGVAIVKEAKAKQTGEDLVLIAEEVRGAGAIAGTTAK
jgi:hypothetical protein